MDKISIIPTGDEILSGTVLDTNSPALMEIFLAHYPAADITRTKPVADNRAAIMLALERQTDCDLIVLIGGSGGGRRYDRELAEDMTHPVLEDMLSEKEVRRIYGPNGHLWSCLVAGYFGKTLVVNVPGPYVEAVAAGQALIRALADGKSIRVLADMVAGAVLRQYPAAQGILQVPEGK